MQPAARLTDLHVCPMVTALVPHVGGPISGPGAPTVLIGGMPAARVSDMAVCVGPPDSIVMGSPTVLIRKAGSGSEVSPRIPSINQDVAP
ncbi:PAAR domain-containing protein [Metallibacterium sp.]|uniref:PAAR domain-containing protein n=1 Tax=Metallibacterium sp. TaxID=2940281 RepID=UPI0031F2E79F